MKPTDWREKDSFLEGLKFWLLGYKRVVKTTHSEPKDGRWLDSGKTLHEDGTGYVRPFWEFDLIRIRYVEDPKAAWWRKLLGKMFDKSDRSQK